MTVGSLTVEIPVAAPRTSRAAAPAAPGAPEAASGRIDTLAEASVNALRQTLAEHGKVVYSCSLGLEAMVLVDLISTRVPQVDIFTLDTGRLHEETYLLLERLERRYGRRIRIVSPDPAELAGLVREHGINGFYHSLDSRTACCETRKLAPFRRAIAGYGAWVTGVRRAQSASRANGDTLAWDEQYKLHKVSPLLDWTEDDVWAYIRRHDVPYNALHERGYPSIGCAPCTRAIQPGEDSRAGRWWWERPETRECGLQRPVHAVPEGL